MSWRATVLRCSAGRVRPPSRDQLIPFGTSHYLHNLLVRIDMKCFFFFRFKSLIRTLSIPEWYRQSRWRRRYRNNTMRQWQCPRQWYTIFQVDVVVHSVHVWHQRRQWHHKCRCMALTVLTYDVDINNDMNRVHDVDNVNRDDIAEQVKTGWRQQRRWRQWAVHTWLTWMTAIEDFWCALWWLPALLS